MRPTSTAAREAVFADLDLEFVVQPARDLTAVTPLHWIVWALEAEQCGGFGAVGEQHDFLEHLACVERVQLRHEPLVIFERRHRIEPWAGLELLDAAIAGGIIARYHSAD